MSRREPAAVRWVGKTALVTGASSGIGRAVALDLARRGARVFVTARREDVLKLLVEEMGGDPHRAIACDVGDLRQVREVAEFVAEHVDHLDVLMNNAGVRSAGPLSSATSEDMEAVIRTNLLGPMFCTRELLPLLQAAPATLRMPVVANVASIAGRVAIPRSADYTASKFGLVGLTESLWHDLTASGIKVMMVNPGPEGGARSGLDGHGAGPGGEGHRARHRTGDLRGAGAVVVPPRLPRCGPGRLGPAGGGDAAGAADPTRL